MLENSFGLNFYLKSPQKKTNIRYIYLRITVDGVRKETSIKRTWDASRWDMKTERAIGSKEDAKALNFFLDALIMKINQYKTDLIYTERTISTKKILTLFWEKLSPRLQLCKNFACTMKKCWHWYPVNMQKPLTNVI